MGKWKKLKRGKLENNVNVVFNSNEEKHLFTKLDEMVFVSFWYYHICILSRSSCTEAFFKGTLMQI